MQHVNMLCCVLHCWSDVLSSIFGPIMSSWLKLVHMHALETLLDEEGKYCAGFLCVAGIDAPACESPHQCL